MECVRCGSTQFQEEGGFYFCFFCQTQSQGFAKEVAADEDEFVQTREVKVGAKKSKEKVVGKQKKTREGLSRWSTVEAFNEIYLGMIADFFAILRQNNLSIDETLFLKTSMQIWFKFLRQCELAFLPTEHIDKLVKLHPASRHRDNFLLGSTLSSSSAESVPLYRHSEAYKSKHTTQIFPQGSNYVVRDEKRAQINDQYFNDDIHSSRYKDPHYYRRKKFANKHTKLSHFARKIVETVIEKESKDGFVEFVENIVTNSEMGIDSSNGTLKPKIEDPKSSDDDQLLDSSNYDDILLKRMPSSLKAIQQFVSIDKLKKYKNTASPLLNNLITKPKLLVLLLITIRLLNLNIFLSDLIRWCVQGNIRYLNSLHHLPNSWELMWLDEGYFKNNRFPSYANLTVLIDFIVGHCCIPRHLFPDIDLDLLARRYIKDLNLPKGLILVLRKKYGSFLNETAKMSESVDNHSLKSFDVIAIIAVIMTLRDLFDLVGPTEPHFAKFRNNSQYENLFIWPDWMDFSKLRLSSIKAFILNINSQNSSKNITDIDEILAKNHVENKLNRDTKETLKNCQDKPRSTEYRFQLQDSFERLLMNDHNLVWPTEISQDANHSLPSSLFPLTDYSEYIHSKIVNSHIKSQLELNYRDKLVTPYMCHEGFSFHRSMYKFPRNLTSKSYTFEDNASDSFLHLIELGSIMTCTDLNQYKNLFDEAQRVANQN